jgi:predicted AAA+ superfamily ATPase
MQTLKEAFNKKKIVPYEDILQNKISENSFAVGFHAVLNGTADAIYNDPKLFFDLTHVTKNLAGIYEDVLSRMAQGGSRPLLVIDTTFGGGKTHTLVALYHLFTNPDIAEKNPEISKILLAMDLTSVPEISLVAIDCHNISSVKRADQARTIWGEIGRQLNQYEIVKIYDQEMRRPDADTLAKLINSTNKPVLIMLDELVNYLKDAKAESVGEQNLAEVTVSFFHTLTDVIVNSKKAMFILTLPGTESAYNEETEILEQYKTKIKEISGREASFTVPMEKSEIYDVIRKRLFRTVDRQYSIEVAENLLKYYAEHQELFPTYVLSNDYRTKISKSYPFHPALVDLLYERIGTIAEFQKTRGVLRLLSHVLKNIYHNIDEIESDPIITPGIVDLNDMDIFQELTNKIAKGEFQSVINSDIVNDEETAKCQKLDHKQAYGSNVRISTAIYLYSLIGSKKETSKGVSQNELVLATSVEGITYPKDVLNDAVNLENSLWYIYNKASKLYFSVEVNLNKVIADETQNIDQILYDPEIKTRLRKMLKSDFFDVYVWEEDVRNPHKPTLVVPNFHSVFGTETTIPTNVKTIIEKEGTSFRSKKNLMYVLVSREDRTTRMIEASRRFLAIKDLKGSKKSREDISTYGDKLEVLLKEADSTLNGAIELCYSLIYYPKGTDTKCITVADGYESAKNMPEKVYNALVKGGKIIETLNPEYIVDRVFGDKTEMTIQELRTTFEEAPIHFLPKNKDVIYDAIIKGVKDKQCALYIGGIGDIIAIDQDNFSSVSEQFYFGHAPEFGLGDGHYLLPKDRAKNIEDQLNYQAKHKSIVSGDSVKEGSQGEGFHGGLTHGNGKQSTITTIIVNDKNITDPDEVAQYSTWLIRSIEIGFKNLRLFQIIKGDLSMMLLGQSGITFNIKIRGQSLDIKITDAEIKDINATMEPLSKLSSLFSKDLSVSIGMHFTKDTKLDQDLIESIKELSTVKSELTFNAHLEK